LSVTTSQGAASEVDKRNILFKAAINALGLDECDSESDDEHTLPAWPGFGYLGNSGARNIQEINVAGDNVEDFSDIQEVIELVRIQQVEIQESQRLYTYPLPEATFPDKYQDKSTRWATVGRARKKDRQALGGDPPDMKFSNYYAVLNAEEIDNEAEIQNVTGEKISAATNDLIRPVGAPNHSQATRETEIMKRQTKRKRKRRRKPTMRGVQFTSSPPTIPCPSRLSDNFYSSEKYIGLVALLREYIKTYRVLGKAHAQAHITRHQMMSMNIGTEIDALDIDPTDFRCAGIIKHVEMNGNYAVDFGQGKMKYISESTLQEILKDRETVRNQSKWRTAIQQEIEMLLLREEFSNIDAPMTDNVWIDERASDGRQLL
jgi:hypothetical protein